MLTETFGNGQCYYSYYTEAEAGLNRSSYFSEMAYRELVYFAKQFSGIEKYSGGGK